MYKEEVWNPPEGLNVEQTKREQEAIQDMLEDESVGGETTSNSVFDEIDVGESEQKAAGRKFKDLEALIKKPELLVVSGLILIVMCLMLMVHSCAKRGDTDTTAESDSQTSKPTQTPVTINAFSYSIEELAALRTNGYTADEVEYYKSLEIPAESLVYDAQIKRQELYEEEIAPYMDAASDEYKELAADTWVGQEEFKLQTDIGDYRYYTEVWNVDYKKLPARGNQLFIKLTVEDGSAVFMNVTPEQYLRLNDSGNIVVTVKYTKMGNGGRVVTDVWEKDISE